MKTLNSNSLIQTWRHFLSSHAIAFSTIAFLWGISGYLIWQQRLHDYASAEGYVSNTAKVLAAHLDGMLDQANLHLLVTGNRYVSAVSSGNQDLLGITDEIKAGASSNPLVHRIGIATSDGTIVLSTGFVEEAQVKPNVSDRDYFKRAKAGHQGLMFSGPLQAKIGGEWSLVISRRLEDKNGKFLGVAIAVIPAEKLGWEFASIDTGRSGVINLRTDDFSQVVRYPDLDGSEVGVGNRNVSQVFQKLVKSNPEKRNHIYQTITPLDGKHRLYAAQRVGDVPLWLFVGIGTEQLDTKWQKLAIGLSAICLVLSVVLLLGIRRLEVKNRQLALRLAEQEKLERELSRLSQVVEQSPENIFITDLDGNIEYANASFYKTSGYSPKDVIGHNPRVLKTNKTPINTYVSLWETISRGDVWSGEFINRTKRGEEYIELAVITPLRNSKNEVTHYVAVKENITEKKEQEIQLAEYRNHLEEMVAKRTVELQTQQRFLSSLIEGLPGMVGYWDSTLHCRFANKAHEEWFGYKPHEMLGISLQELLGGRLYAENEPYILGALQGEPQAFERSRYKVNGELGYMYAHYLPDIEDGEVRGFLACVDDITRLKETQRALELAKDKAEEASRAKSEFLANMSHEIRTPLNAVLGFAQIGYRENVNRKMAQETFSRILDSGRLLLSVINDILDFSKIEAGKLSIEEVPIDLNRLLEDVVRGPAMVAAEKGLELVIDIKDSPQAILGDPTRITQILINLLSNAIKFTENGEVRLRVFTTQDRLIAKVSDTGIGISPGALERLFDPFEQEDVSTTRKYGGTGLGLSICQRLVALMEGGLNVESVVGDGTTFTLDLPLKLAELPVSNQQIPINANGNGRLQDISLLVAEDNQINQLVIEAMLLGEGARIVFADNGRHALDLVENGENRFDAILMDVQMPFMDGLEATRRLKALNPDLPIIGQTAHAFREEVEKCLAAGMTAVIHKPIDLEILVSTINDILGQPGSPADKENESVFLLKPSDTPIDWIALKAQFPAKPDLIDRLVQTFLQQHRSDGDQLRDLSNSQDSSGIERLAHNLKGIAGNMFMHEVRRRAEVTLEHSRNNSPSTYELAIHLAEAVDEVCSHIQVQMPQFSC